MSEPDIHEGQEVENTSSPSRSGRRTFLVSVTASVVASILVGVFFQPIIAFISDIIISFISVFYRGWIDSIYRQAAGSTLFLAIYALVTIITTIPSGVASAILIIMYIDTGTSRFSTRVRGTFSLRIGRRLLTVLAALTVPLVLIINTRMYAEFQATATFDQRLMALAPVISDQERKSLLGQWAMMKSRADYDKVNARFEELAEKYHTELPSPYI